MIYTDNWKQDVLNILVAIDGFFEGYIKEELTVESVDIDTARVEQVVKYYTHNFPHMHGGIKEASAFKKSAVFLCSFISMKPITNVDYPCGIDQHYSFSHPLAKYGPNAVFAIAFVVHLLLGVRINGRKDGRECLISRQIAITEHSYNDLMCALSSDITPEHHWMLLAILLEQMVYKTNPGCQYTDFVFGDAEYIKMVKKAQELGGQYD